jgi:hypothetical protein
VAFAAWFGGKGPKKVDELRGDANHFSWVEPIPQGRLGVQRGVCVAFSNGASGLRGATAVAGSLRFGTAYFWNQRIGQAKRHRKSTDKQLVYSRVSDFAFNWADRSRHINATSRCKLVAIHDRVHRNVDDVGLDSD